MPFTFADVDVILPVLSHALARMHHPQADLNDNISAAAAAAKEAKFFKTDSFFGSEQVAAHRGRFGVDNLRSALSMQLVSLTQRELPKMKQALEEAIEKVWPRLLRSWFDVLHCTGCARVGAVGR